VDYAEQRFSSRQVTGIAFVVLLHVAIIYALVGGLGEQAIQILRQPLQAKIITQPKLLPPEAPPPPPPQMLTPPPPFIPPPLVQIAQPPPVPVIAQVTHVQPATSRPPVQAPTPAPTPAAVRSGASMVSGSCAAPQYPEAAEDLEQTGTSVLQFLISASGAVLQSRVAVSSGHSSLDDAAVAALSQCRFSPAMGSDGKPQEAWTSISYVWQLN
jgi:protein TonB